MGGDHRVAVPAGSLSGRHLRSDLAMPFSHPTEWTLLVVLQAALTVWMLVDANRRGVEPVWFWAILVFQPVGAWAYFFSYKVHDLQLRSGWLADLFRRRPSLEELRHRANQSPTPANWLALGERLIEVKEYPEALPHLEAVLSREPEHCQSLFLLAVAHRHLGQPAQAVPALEKLLARNPSWGDYKAWSVLVEVCHEAGDPAGALRRCRELARIAPTLQHKCLLAENLLETGETVEARKIVEQGLEDYRYRTGPSRRRDGRWVGKAKQLLKQMD